MNWEQWWEQLADSTWLERQFYGNEVVWWLVAVAAFVSLLFLLRLVTRIVRRRVGALAEQTNYYVAHAVVGLAGAIKPWFLFVVSLYLGSLNLEFGHKTTGFLQWVTVTALLMQLAFWADVLITLFLRRYVQTRMETDAASVTTMSGLSFFGRLGVWTLTVLLVLQNADVEVSALVAGLGIGGVAVALAAQSVLGDLFASLAIVLDKPFILGDFIAVNECLGSVEHIGLKTTRIRSLSGEQLIFANADLLHGRIRNYKRMYERRIEFSFGVEYGTPPDKLATMPDMIRSAIEAQQTTRFDRAHFKSFGASSLLFEAVYYVLSPDYNIYMDIQQAINLALVRRFAEAEIHFALPTQTLYVHRTPDH
ncbi:MAG TPA: mechanosensitive ion channel family protein [Pirellulales bacterium]|nr:mechanosensitive ion channel family protein [Pirellulales bacterium]